MSTETKYCYKCGKKISADSKYCPQCKANQSSESKIDSMSSGIKAICCLLGVGLIGLGIIFIIGSILGLIMKAPMENPNTKHAWAIGQIFYGLFIMTGFIEVSIPLGIFCLIAGLILIKVGE